MKVPNYVISERIVHPFEVIFLLRESLPGGLKRASICIWIIVSIFHYLKLELLTQFPASNDEKYFSLCQMDIAQTGMDY